MIKVVNKRTYKGKGEWICRGRSLLGNPFKMKKEPDREKVINDYKKWFEYQRKYSIEAFDEINRLIDIAREGDLTLICWCAPKACHGDVIKEYIERQLKC